MNALKIAIASGKGGTGKTTVATNLAWTAARKGLRVVYADCDVEEPNGHLFLKPEITGKRDVTQFIPEVDAGKCSLCGLCGQICQFSAIAPMGEKVLVFADLCHACGGCILVCPTHAIHEKPIVLGVVESGQWFVSETRCGPMVHARLDPAAGNSGKLVSQLRRKARELAEVSEAQIHKQAVVEYDPAAGISDDIKHLWEFLNSRLPKPRPPVQESAADEFGNAHANE